MAESSGGLSGIIAERYAIEGEIGRGGMAVVYLARDLRHNALVAVKVLNPELAARVGVERFSREIRITASLEHPNILSVFDSGEADGLPYCVMPYVEGETLDARIRRLGPLPFEEALEIAAEIADGLAYAHARGFVHRDVKPSNILLSHGHARLADFGIARAVDAAGYDRLTTAGLAVGTASYMSPEQASGEEVDGRSDIYALGCVLYEMLAGAPPFAGASARAILARHMADTVPSLRTVRETVPPALEAAIMKAMAKLPADRYPDAGAFRDALRQLDAAEAPSPRRQFTRIGLATAALVVAGVGLVFGRGMFGGGEPLDPDRIMVFPLDAAGVQGSAAIGENIATMIGNALDGTGSLRWIDGWQHLSATSRENIRELDEDGLRSIARAQRCAFYVSGRVTPLGDSVTVTLLLNDASGNADPVRGTATAPVGEEWMGFSAVNALLPRLIPGGASDVTEAWEHRPPAAIANFLVAEREFRRIHLAAALEHYQAAIEADSTFAFAALRGAQAASWNHRESEAASLIAVALRQPLSPRDAAFARGYRAYLEGRADSALAAFHAALDSDPEMAVAWLQLGETWTHLLPKMGVPNDSALLAFREATRLDSLATNPLYHLIEILLRKGDVAGAAPLVDRFLRAGPEDRYAEEIRIAFDCLQQGPERVAWDSVANRNPFELMVASFLLSGGSVRPACAEAGYDALLRTDTSADVAAESRRFFEILGLQNLLLAEGRDDEALARVDAFVARWGSGTTIYLLDAPYSAAFAGRARETAARDAERYGTDYRRFDFGNGLWELGIYELGRGNLDITAAIAGELRRRAARGDPGHDALLATSLEAYLTLARGDTARALGEFDALVPAFAPGDSLKYDEVMPLGAERLQLARLLAARGDYERAIDVANVFDSNWPVIHTLYLAPSLMLRADAADALGETGLATTFRARLDALQGRPRGEP